jgi:NAD-dependent dihydropyrimidine dehydrogenase PreA subunit
MAFVIIADACIACGACKEECPTGAIEAFGDRFRITEGCSECATCMETCPAGAVVED